MHQLISHKREMEASHVVSFWTEKRDLERYWGKTRDVQVGEGEVVVEVELSTPVDFMMGMWWYESKHVRYVVVCKEEARKLYKLLVSEGYIKV